MRSLFRRFKVAPLCYVALIGPLAASTLPAQSSRPTQVAIELGVDTAGRASPQWLAMLRRRLRPGAYDSAMRLRRPLTADDTAWAHLLQSQATGWQRMLPPLVALYAPAAPPARVLVVLGNRGAEDAFTHDPQTIGFDLAALQRNYGSASQASNRERIDRFFRHEFTHLMQKAWWSLQDWPITAPLDFALADMWAEGLGNYYSLSDRWISDGRLTSMADSVLNELAPQLLGHLRALACADSAAAAPHLATLSAGPFARKWGALPVALWLARDAHDDASVLRRFIVAGPPGVWELANRHLEPELRPQLQEVRATAARCAPPGPVR